MKKIYSQVYILILFVCASLSTFAQVSTYTFGSSSGSYSSIVGGGGTVVVATSGFDQSFGTFPIGFTFIYNGSNYTTFGLNMNGFISLGYVPVSTDHALSSGLNNYVIAGFNGSLYGADPGAQISYQTSGSAGSRVLTVEWTNWGYFSTGGNEFNFQIKLLEGTNKIQIVYGSCPGSTSATLQVGLRGQTNADFNNRTTTTNWSATTAGGTNSANCTYNSSVKPSSGLKFEWTPSANARTVGTITSVQQTGTAAPGSTGNGILRVDIPVTGTAGTLTLSSIIVASKNTTDNDITTGGVKIWTGTITAPTTQVGSGASFSSGNATISSINTALITGTNYIWVTFDIKTTAVVGDVLDAKINIGAISITASGGAVSPGSQPTTLLNPNGSKTVNYCTPYSTLGGCIGDRIQGFAFAGINYTGGSCIASPGYLDVGTTGTGIQGQPYNFTLTLEDGNDYGAIWIDFNDNTTFDDAGEQVYSGGPGTSLSGTITVPPTTSVGTHRVRVRNNYGAIPPGSCGSISYGETKDFRLTVNAGTNCSGTPAASNTLSSLNPVCPGSNFTLSLSATYLNLGITYQWQSSPTGSTYTNISGATSYSYILSQTSSTYYRCQVTCTNSGQSIFSTPLQENMNSFYNCYCTPVTDCTDDKITSVVFAGISNTTNNACASNGYSDYTSQSGTVTQGTIQSISIGVNNGGTEHISVWIDYNHNAVFDAGERIYIGSGFSQTISKNIQIPSSALTGVTRLRVRLEFAAEPTDPCADLDFGETEDYLVNITTCNNLFTYYVDADQDTYGSTSVATLCYSTPPTGYSTNNTDCNDNDAAVHSPQQYYVDADQDGYGSTTTAMLCSSTAPSGYSTNNTDCNDNNASIRPNATESCNGIDDNCSGQVDEGVKITFYSDADNDTYGNPNSTTLACSVPTGYVSNNTDCNDANAAIHPNATETCNSIDDDCDGQVDEGVKITFYLDSDHDTYGNPNSTTLACSAPTNYVSNNTDCNDASAAIHPNAAETCNGVDDDCDGVVDEGVKSTFYADADVDTYGNPSSTTLACSAPTGYVSNNTDCNDANASIHPNATETCNGVDDDCDGAVDEGVKSTFYLDADHDTYGNVNSTTLACSAPTNYVSNSTDCNDANAAVHPGATEVCNTIDDDCDGVVDEGVKSTFYEDADGDAYGNVNSTTLACTAPVGYVNNSTDCNDNYDNIHPGATEECNGFDDNCNGTTDEGCGSYTYFADNDNDTYGNPNNSITSSSPTPPAGYVVNNTDCNDANAAIHPNATETCNGIDDDCDGPVDEGVTTTFYADADHDTYGNPNSTTLACSAPTNYVSNNTDCNDTNAAIHPNATETCNGVDDDCDGAVDEGVKSTFYADADADTYGNPNSTTLACSAPAGYVSNNTDCNDANAAIHPNAAETCNGIDDDCDGAVDEGVKSTFYADADADTYGNPNSTTLACSAPSGYVSNNTDCNDANAAIHPNAAETCNGIDDDCDGAVDEGVKSTFYADADADTYGNPNSTTLACSAPAGYVTNNTDCNDANAAVHPGASEQCNTVDDNCNGQIDEGVTFNNYYADLDNDSYGATFLGSLCLAPPNSSLVPGDCNDANAAIHPNAAETCNGIDDDCDGAVDEGVKSTFYADTDADTYGNPNSTTLACSVPTGYVSNNTDCNDANAAIHPNAAETCNGVDDDCDGAVDEGVKSTFYLDADHDNYGNVNSTTLACSAPTNYVSNSTDCNDANASIHPNAAETCNGIDDDCDGAVDEGVKSTFYADADVDTYGNPSSTTLACSAPTGYVSNNTDCNDANASIHPNAAETCNGVDDDCDGAVDEGVKSTFYADADVDTYGNPSSTTLACSAPTGYVSNNTDCNDANASIHPNATETCNGVDDDCDGAVDEGVKSTFYLDADHDTYGNVNSTTLACSAPTNYVSNSTDCNDANAAIHPGATETCNGIDEDCDGVVDEGVKSTFYADADVDTYGNPSSTTLACSAPTGYVSNNTDCNDANASIHPNAAETCNGVDEDCDGAVDEGVKSTFYADADADTYGNVNSTTLACSAPTGYVSNNTDCNDANASIHPNAAETCNGVDEDCDGAVDEGVKSTFYLDADHDNYGNVNSTTLACSAPTNYVSNSTDCNDSNAGVHPGATEVCNGIDDNCNGTTDEGCGSTYTYFADADNDTYGNPNSSITSSSPTPPAGYAANNTDCNDANAAIHPGVSDVCNSIDDNCNGVTDENAFTATVTPAGSVAFCKGSAFVLTASGGTGITYQWIKGSQNITGATNQTYAPTKTASYKVKETNSFNCSSTSAATSVTVNLQPTATITPQGSLDICGTGSVVLMANSGSGYTYQWMKGIATIAGATNQSYTATVKSTYKVIVTNSNGCSKTSAGAKVTKSCKEELMSDVNLPASFALYPNPSDGLFVLQLQLQNDFSGDATISIVNTLGQIILDEVVPVYDGTVTHAIHLSNGVAAGMYIVKIMVDDKVFTTQLVINR